MLKKVFLLSFINLLFLNSCMVSINQDVYDAENQFQAIIEAYPVSIEVGNDILFRVNNLEYMGSKMFGIPKIYEYAWDLNCDGKVDEYTKIGLLNKKFSEEGAFKVCVSFTFYMENNNTARRSIIKNNNFNDYVYVHSKIASFDISVSEFEVVAGELSKEIVIIAKNNKSEIIKNAGISLQTEQNNFIYVKDSNEELILQNQYKSDENGTLKVYLKVKENILVDNVFNDLAYLKVKSNSNVGLIEEKLEFKVLPSDLETIEIISLGGDLKIQDRFNEANDFGELKFRLLDRYNNPIYLSTIEVNIREENGDYINKDWRLNYDGLSGEDLILISSDINVEINDIGTINFIVEKNNDKSVGKAKILLNGANNVNYEYYNEIVLGELLPANLEIKSDTSSFFGELALNQASSPLLFTLSNNGEKTANIDILSSQIDGAFYYSGDTYPGINGTCSDIIDTNMSCKVELVFKPINVSSYSLNFEVFYNNGIEDTSAVLGISGVGVQVSYGIGSVGPGGGIIFYENPNYLVDDWRYLEVAPADAPSNLKWQDPYLEIGISAQGESVGYGSSNTKNIANFLRSNGQNSNRAALYCDEYSNNSKSDWFLPSIDELEELYIKRFLVNNLGAYFYYSSSEVSAYIDSAWVYNFISGGTNTSLKDTTLWIRCIRSFTDIIKYDANGASSGTVPAYQIKQYAKDLVLAYNSGNLEKAGYTFEAWNTKADGTGINYIEASTYTLNEGVTLYAKWTESIATNITNCIMLQNINNDLTANYVLLNDINCSDTVNWNSGEGFIPIGNSTNKFTGKLNGNNYKITGLYINRPNSTDMALFGVSNGSEIKNINFENTTIYSRNRSATLIGRAENTQIEYINSYNLYIEAKNRAIGGIVGNLALNSKVYRSSSSGVLVRKDDNEWNEVGGLVGSMTDSTVEECFSTVDISSLAHNRYGGLIGIVASNSNVINSYARGSVSGTNSLAGGLVSHLNTNSNIVNSYSTGFVFAPGSYVGGFLGYRQSGICNDSFWDTQTSNQATSDCATGKTSDQMKNSSTYTNWDFGNVWSIDSNINDGYPYLKWTE